MRKQTPEERAKLRQLGKIKNALGAVLERPLDSENEWYRRSDKCGLAVTLVGQFDQETGKIYSFISKFAPVFRPHQAVLDASAL